MQFLALSEVRTRAREVREALSRLRSNRSVVARPRARQWRFLEACAERTLDGSERTEFDDLSPGKAAQLKFEVQDRLRRHYLRSRELGEVVLTLLHRTELEDYRLEKPADYPDVAGYCLLIRDPFGDRTLPPEEERIESYLESVIGQGVDAEFQVYLAVPAYDARVLEPWFVEDGPAFREIVERAERRRRQGWTLQNPWNPSTKRLMSVRVRWVRETEALVGSTEYWYLRWWTERLRDYVYSYRQTIRNQYILRRDGEAWRVFQNLKPSPRAVAPNRRARVG